MSAAAVQTLQGLLADQNDFEVKILTVAGPTPIIGTVESSRDDVVTVRLSNETVSHVSIAHIVSINVGA